MKTVTQDLERQLFSPEALAPAVPINRVRPLRELANVAIRDLDADALWPELQKILHLHAVSDEACAGLGLFDRRGQKKSPFMHYTLCAADRLTSDHTLSTFPTDRIRVLPKTRTPQSGITIRSLSHHIAADHCDVDVTWIRTQHPSVVDEYMRLRLLLFPWPFLVSNDDFVAAGSSFAELPAEKFGFFEYRPQYDANDLFQIFNKTLEIATQGTGDIDGVVLPESAVSEHEFDELWKIAEQKGVHVLLAGVRMLERAGLAQPAEVPRVCNVAVLRIGTGAAPETYYQKKHHRWFLDRSQIDNYKLAHTLNPARRWWENTLIGKRTLNIVAFNDWLTLCHLICEDLARIDPVSRLVRAVGPTLVIALLLDGPQLPGRWPARYATVLADDPGSSVLTLTSLGMAERSCPPGVQTPSRTVAMWKDSRSGYQAIDLEPKSSGIVLTLWGERIEEFTADGRSDGTMAGRITLGDRRQIRGALKD